MIYSERHRHLLFHTTVWVYKLADPNVLDEYAEMFKKLRDNGEGFNPNPLSWCSPDDLHLREDWLGIKDIFEDRLSAVIEDCGIIAKGIKTQCMWGNIHKTGSSHQLHSHPNSVFSGVMYLETPNEGDDYAGDIMFRDPRGVAPYQHVFNYIDPRDDPSDMWTFKPEKGLIIIFPSWLEHCTNRCSFSPDKERISMSFNAILDTTVDKHSIKLNYYD